MFGDRTLEPGLIFVVERARGFVEEPHRRRCRDETGERDPSTLARGQPAARPVGNAIKGKCGQRCFDEARHPAPLDAAECHPERQNLARRQAGFYAVLMADKIELRAVDGALGLDRPGTPNEATLGRPDKCRKYPQQAGLAAAVGSGEQESAACREAKREPGKNQALAAPAGESLGDQIGGGFGQCARQRKKRLRWGKTGAARPRSNCSTEYEVWGTNL